jgi:GH24 family phage-related lysozyme (muramidase)
MAIISERDPELVGFVKSREGEIAWVYFDSVGLPTVGIGHLVGKVRRATEAERIEDLLEIHGTFGFFKVGVRVEPRWVEARLVSLLTIPGADRRGKDAEFWRALPQGTPHVEMTHDGMWALYYRDLRARIQGLRARWPGADLGALPRDVQIVLVDIAFNAGAARLQDPPFADFRDAIDRRDFATAATIVGTGGIPISKPVRNARRAALLRRAAGP